MRRWSAALCALVAALVSAGAGQPEAAQAPEASSRAIEILERAAAALKAVSAVRYSARIQPRGVGEKFWPAAEGTAVLAGWDPALRRPARFYFDLRTRRTGSPQQIGVTSGGNGETFFVIDHGTKKGYEDIDPLVLGSHGQTLARFEMTEFVQENPLQDEIHARQLEYLGTRSFEGRECYEVHVKYSQGRGEATWLFATDDLLPRWRLQSFSIPQGDGSLEISILELEVDPPLPSGFFDFKLPQGYGKVDDFAP